MCSCCSSSQTFAQPESEDNINPAIAATTAANNNFMTFFILEMVEGEAEGYDEDDEERKEYLDAVKSYRKGGKVYKLMAEIEQPPEPNADLVRVLSETQPQKKREKELLDILKDGVRFTEPRLRPIFSYEYDPFRDDENDEHPIEMDRMIRFVYDRDIVRRYLIDTINDELNCGSGETIPCTCLTLTPDTDSVFKSDTFPEEFFAWMDNLLECVNDR